MTAEFCPNCGSENIYFSKKRNIYICEDCGDGFVKPAQESEKRLEKPVQEEEKRLEKPVQESEKRLEKSARESEKRFEKSARESEKGFEESAQDGESGSDKPQTETGSSRGSAGEGMQCEEGGWNTPLLCDGYWCDEFTDCAPLALSKAYGMLKEYTAQGNIVCCDFVARDVFELMVKFPVLVLFNWVCDLVEKNENYRTVFEKYPAAEALFGNSFKKLTAGKWFECALCGASLGRAMKSGELFASCRESVYRETVIHLEKIKSLFSFYSPSEDGFTEMVKWRNNTLGHSCFVANQDKNINEFPYILKMFKEIARESLPYYKRVFFADEKKTALRGIGSKALTKQLYIGFKCEGASARRGEENETAKRSGFSREGSDETKEDAMIVYKKIHEFVAGESENFSLYNGSFNNKFYMLNYENGEQFADEKLGSYMAGIKKIYEPDEGQALALAGDINEDTLESADINRLEEYLSKDEKIEPPVYFYSALNDKLHENKSGIIHISAQMGMGKSVFAESLNQLHLSCKMADSLKKCKQWKELMDTSCIRVWHFNSTYYGRKNFYLRGLENGLNTLEAGKVKDGKYTEPNMINSEGLQELWNNVKGCGEPLRHMYFSQIINETAQQHLSRSTKERFILVLDGVDEPPDGETLFSFLPHKNELKDNIYIVITTRVPEELAQTARERLEKLPRAAVLEFAKDHIKDGEDYTDGNKEYKDAVLKYTLKRKNGYKGRLKASPEQIASLFDYRFSEIGAYFRLCDKSEAFMDIGNQAQGSAGIMKIFLDYVKNNSTQMFYGEMKRILQVLCFCGDELTLNELAFLSGGGCVSFRLLGMLHDLSAFITVKRNRHGSESESRYGFSHEQWREETAALMPDGGVYFRRRCAGLLRGIQEMAQGGEALKILEKGYEGERWLLIHLLEIYNTGYRELAENWFEDIKIAVVEDFIQEAAEEFENKTKDISAKGPDAAAGKSGREQPGAEVIAGKSGRRQLSAEAIIERLELEKISEDYIEAFNIFGTGSAIWKQRHEGISFSKDSSLLKSTVRLFKRAGCETGSSRKMIRYMDNAGYFMNSRAAQARPGQKTDLFHEISHEIIKKVKDIHDEKLKGIGCYLVGRDYEYAHEYVKAASWYGKCIDDLTASEPDAQTQEYLCRAYVRKGRIYARRVNKNCFGKAAQPVQNDLERALEIAENLLKLDDNALYSDDKRMCEKELSGLYKKLGDMEKAVEYALRALETSNETLKKEDTFKYRKKKCFCLSILSDIYMETGEFEKALEKAQEAYDMEKNLFRDPYRDSAKRLAELSYKLGETEKYEYYRAIYEGYMESEEEIAGICSEVYAFLQFADRETLESLPSYIKFAARNYRDKSYDPGFTGAQDALERMSPYAAAFIEDYIDLSRANRSDTVTAAGRQHFFEYMKAEAACCGSCINPEEAGSSPAANEVCSILNKFFPRQLIEKIPVEALLRLKRISVSGYKCDPDSKEISDYHPDTVPLLKAVLLKAGIISAYFISPE